MSTWIETEHVEQAMTGQSIAELEAGSLTYCLSKSAGYCVLIRAHSAWLTDEGWRDANVAPDTAEEGRLVINFFKLRKNGKTGYWFKIFVPVSEKKITLESIDDQSFCIQSNGKKSFVQFSSLDRLMWDVMTGKDEPESEIEMKYHLLCSSGRKQTP